MARIYYYISINVIGTNVREIHVARVLTRTDESEPARRTVRTLFLETRDLNRVLTRVYTRVRNRVPGFVGSVKRIRNACTFVIDSN